MPLNMPLTMLEAQHTPPAADVTAHGYDDERQT